MLQTYLLHSSPPRVLSSSGDLLPFSALPIYLFEQFPFLEAIWPSLMQTLNEGELIRIPYIYAPHPKLEGYYHFEFTPGNLISSSLFLHIINCTSEAIAKLEDLQRRNEQAILNAFVNIPT